ncbi:MAG: alpha/beta fold hydrolase [Gemmatimonadota bacterium]
MTTHTMASAARRARLAVPALAVLACASNGEHPGTTAGRQAIAAPPAAPTPLELGSCTAPGWDGEARCGSYAVPLDHADPDGRSIEVSVVVLPATGDEPAADPIFFIQGGPGGSTASLIPLAGPMGAIHAARDLVFLDQRGTGGSHALKCDVSTPDDVLEVVYGLSLEDRVGSCIAGLAGLDPALFTTAAAVEDLEIVRHALGYERVNLWAGSYGTRVALAFARRHPGSVRTMYLRGVAGTDYRLPLLFARGAQDALDTLAADCAQSEACTALGDLRETLDRVALRVRKDPALAPVPGAAGAATGESVTITEDVLLGGIRFLLYDPSWSALIPGILAAADGGDFGPFLQIALPLGLGLRSQFSFGMTLAVVCAEDLPRIRETQVGPSSAGTFLGDRVIRGLQRTCAAWPASAAPEGFHRPVASDIPTLAITGALDPVTPEASATEALAGLSNVLHLVFANLGHSPPFTPCVLGLYGRFLEAGSIDGLDDCGEGPPRPPFPGAGP